MAAQLDRDGIFRAIPLDFVLRPQKEGEKTVMVGVRFQITDHLEGKEWKDWREFGMESYGDFCVVKKDGTVNTTTVEFLHEGLGWDGQSFGIDKLNPCQIVVKPEEYNGTTKYRPQWVNPYDYTPQGMAKASVDDEKGFLTKFGAQMRAICGSKQTKAPKPAGTPAAPPARQASALGRMSAPPVRKAAANASSNGSATATLLASNRDEAWNYVVEGLKDKKLTQDQVNEKFYASVDKVAASSSKSEDEFGPEQWSEVADDAVIPF